jgi:uncharacterized protein with HEPN domain
MQADKRDAGYLWDMREALSDCLKFVQSSTYDDFCGNAMMHAAVERRLEILGEAGGHVSKEFQLAHSEIPWKEITGIRVILAHRYGEVNLEELWRTVTKDLPNLLPKLDALIPTR